MNALYFTIEDITADSASGILKKIIGQVEAMNELNINTWYSYRHDFSDYIFDNGGRKICYKLSGYHKLGWKKAIYKIIENFILKNSVDIVYIRSLCIDKGFMGLLKNIRKHTKYIYYEITTYPISGETRNGYITAFRNHKYISLIKGFMINSIDKFYCIRLKYYVNYIVTYTNYKKIFGIPVVQIENGIDVSKISLREKKENRGSVILIGVANVQRWHGYDRVIKGLADYYKKSGKEEVQFWIVGDGAAVPCLKNLTLQNNLQEYVKFLGCKTGNVLDDLFNMSDIGVSSLGYHRIGLTQGSTLKTREYCARGIPFIYSYDEPMIDGNNIFSLKFDSDDSSIDIQKVIEFYNISTSVPGLKEIMRKFAEQNYGWSIQMKKVFALIK